MFVLSIAGKEYGYSKCIPIRKNRKNSDYLISVRCSSRESKNKIACKASGVVTTKNKDMD
jgi:hypothetical protein